MSDKSGCTRISNERLITVKEKGRKAIFLNDLREDYAITHVDGCLINEGERCDYLVVKGGIGSVLIELKGVSVDKACKQLESTIQKKEVQNLLQGPVGFLIVCSKFPRVDTFVLRAKQKFAKKYHAGLTVVSRNEVHKICQICVIGGQRRR